jgi:hypothetical protein
MNEFEAFNSFVVFLVEDVELAQAVVWEGKAFVQSCSSVVMLASPFKVILPRQRMENVSMFEGCENDEQVLP